ncbi:type III-B CRISPR module-associated protein Cmr5 [uncultured Treponema sp.]|uniref:type III-B CRISPR module-associated protein Cmr5 n=1 Tax=uncultured Treponema sp. TaxID=162155 RepID=UPI000E800324|nr:type III-B CRISPR module-associated protein Cmr5 [uncultured Treponema sp.]HAZ96755.1 type III-B CRISPR module-associated protein Cmr5 [Treponema sp.]
MPIQTKQQKRAEFALKSLDKYKDSGVPSTYATFIVGMPNMILSNGLGQSLAFLKAKSSKKEREFVFGILKSYLQKEFSSSFVNVKDDFAFLSKINSISQNEYIKMQEEVLRMLEWLKRYARAFEGAKDSEQ